jgi:hypothetical protein
VRGVALHARRGRVESRFGLCRRVT